MPPIERYVGHQELGIPRKLPSAPESWSQFLTQSVPEVSHPEDIAELPTPEYLAYVHDRIVSTVSSENYHDEDGYISTASWRRLVQSGVLMPVLGDRDPERRQEESMQIARMMAYYDLHLGLTYGIVAALGVRPIQKFANESQQQELLGMLRDGELIGLGVTEWKKPGTTALDMESSYTTGDDDTVVLKLSKHLQGHSGTGGLIVAASKDGAASKTLGLIFVPQQHIETETIETMGLHGVRYGVNTGEIELPKEQFLLAELGRRDLNKFLEIFIESRYMFPGTVLGHIERTRAQAELWAQHRMVSGKPQHELTDVRRAIDRMDAGRVVAEAIYTHILHDRRIYEDALWEHDGDDLLTEANIAKTLPTHYAIAASASRAVLSGGWAFYRDGALQDYVDIWPFGIFEGPEPMLNRQVGHMFLKDVRRKKRLDPHMSFIDAFVAHAEDKDIYQTDSVLENLNRRTTALLTSLSLADITDEHVGTVGEMLNRIYALGCLTEENVGDDQRGRAIDFVNLEITQILMEFVDAELTLT